MGPRIRRWWPAWPLLGLTLAQCACWVGTTRAPVASTAEPGPAAGLAWCAVSREPVTLADGSDVYIEPEGLVRSGPDVLVAGSPTYTWAIGPGSRATMSSREAHLAARLGAAGVTAVEKPVDVRVGDVRVTALDSGRWAVLFEEIGPDSVPLSERLRAVWYAEREGGRWAAVERLPALADGRWDFSASSALMRAGSRLVWAVPARRPGMDGAVLLYEREGGVWRATGALDAWAETTALAIGPSGESWLAVVSEDPDLPGWQKSLRLYRLDADPVGWSLVSRVWVAAEGSEIYDPDVRVLAAGATVTWRSISRDADVGLARVGITSEGGGTRVTLDDAAIQVEPVALRDGTLAWVVDHFDEPSGASELRLVQTTHRRGTLVASVVASIPNPYTGFFAALSTAPTEVLVIGPEFDPDPARTTVRSLLLRLSTSCT